MGLWKYNRRSFSCGQEFYLFLTMVADKVVKVTILPFEIVDIQLHLLHCSKLIIDNGWLANLYKQLFERLVHIFKINVIRSLKEVKLKLHTREINFSFFFSHAKIIDEDSFINQFLTDILNTVEQIRAIFEPYFQVSKVW